MEYPHLIETTMLNYKRRTFVPAVGYPREMLSDEEKIVVAESKAYEAKEEIAEYRRVLNEAIRDFEKLNKIPRMPKAAKEILREWQDDE